MPKASVADQSVEQIAALKVSPQGALNIIRTVTSKSSPSNDEQLFEALRSATWYLLTFRNYSDTDMRAWHDTFRQAENLVSPFYATQIRTFADLVRIFAQPDDTTMSQSLSHSRI